MIHHLHHMIPPLLDLGSDDVPLPYGNALGRDAVQALEESHDDFMMESDAEEEEEEDPTGGNSGAITYGGRMVFQPGEKEGRDGVK